MNFYVNEISMHGQYQSDSELKEAIRQLTELVNCIQEQVLKRSLYNDRMLFYRNATQDVIFSAAIERIADKSLVRAFRNVILNKLNAKDWRETSVHNADDMYICKIYLDNDGVVSGTTVAEAAERQLNTENEPHILLNFNKSCFSGFSENSVVVEKQEECKIHLLQFESKEQFENWFVPTLPLVYSYISTIRDDIYTGRAPSGIKRLDTPSAPDGKVLHGEKIHITFRDDSALYYDGIWKHETNRKVTNEERIYLEKYGFIVPKN